MSYASLPPPVSEAHQQAAKAMASDFERRWRENHRWKQVKWHLYLLSLRLFYRHFSRVIHYFGMHRMKRMHPMGGNPFYRCDWCGMHGTKVEGPAKGITDPVSTQKERRYILSGGLCVTCSQHMANEMMPPHDASPRCESGKRNHCSCDVCF